MRSVMLALLLLLCLTAPSAGRSTHGLPDAATEQQAWWGDMARGYVVGGCLPALPVPASLTLSLPECRAYALERGTPRRLYYLWEPAARSLTLPAATGRTWLAGHASVTDAVAGWTRVPGTHYLWQASAIIPTVPDGGVLLAALDVSGGVITAIGDARPDSPIPGAAANLRSPLFGAAGDCSADDTEAMQRWINNTAWRNTEGYAPAGCYKFTRLWFVWDETNNPGFPPAAVERGGYLVRGAGPAQMYHMTQDKRTWPGTTFWSTTTDAPAFNAFAPIGVGSGNLGRGVRIENLSLVQNTSSAIMDFDGVHSRSGLRDLFVVQEGTGFGILWHNSFLAWMEDIFVTATNRETNLGVGIQLQNKDTAGGIIRLVNVTARNFGVSCLRVGSLALEASRLQTVYMQGAQGGSCDIGLQVWGGVRSLVCDGCYFEGFRDYGVFIKENAQGVSIVNSWFSAGQMDESTDAAIRIGGGSGALSDSAYAVTIQNNTVVDVTIGSAIWRDIGSGVEGTVVMTNHIHLGPDANNGIYCGTGGITSENQLMLFGNTFYGGGTNLVDASCRTGEVIHDPSALWLGRRVNFGQGVTLPSAATITLPPTGNLYHLTGTAQVSTITCPACTNGAFVWFYVPQGNTPSMDETGNILLAGAAAGSVWNGTSNDMIGLVYDSGKWVEMHRSDN